MKWILDSDLAVAVRMINEDSPLNSPYRMLAQECKALTDSMGSSLKHTLRERNKVADKLANLGVVRREDGVPCYSAGGHIPQLEADIAGVSYERV